MSLTLHGAPPHVEPPQPGFQAYHWQNASTVAIADRAPLMAAMNDLIAVNWQASEPHWTETASPFDPTFSLVVIFGGGELAAFSVYRVLRVQGRAAVYRSGTEVLPKYQGQGFYGFFTREIMKAAETARECGTEILYGWRTRNPIVWTANAKLCDAVTPSLLGDSPDAALQEAGVAFCAALYPGKALDTPGMVMRGAYSHITHRRQAYHGMASLVSAAIDRVAPDPADALFSVGLARL